MIFYPGVEGGFFLPHGSGSQVIEEGKVENASSGFDKAQVQVDVLEKEYNGL